MKQTARSIRPFLGAKNYQVSRQFYADLGFEETILSPVLSLFRKDEIGFYLQDAYIKDWIDNTMVFLEVKDVVSCFNSLLLLQLPAKYPAVRLIPVRSESWGRECFLHDPSGILWHFGEFSGY